MFAKVFSQIFDSSIAQNFTTRHVFMDLLVLADPTGAVDMTADAISRRTNVPIEKITEAIAELSAPDTQSRSPNDDGRRIVLLDPHRSWGWQIVNYEHYRAMRDEEARRSYFREYQRERRGKSVKDKKVTKKRHRVLNSVNTCQHLSTQEEVEGEEEVEEVKSSPVAKAPEPATDQLFLTEISRHYPDINVDRELGKMRAWLLLPKAKGRKLTKTFIIRWLNKADPGVIHETQPDPPKPKELPKINEDHVQAYLREQYKAHVGKTFPNLPQSTQRDYLKHLAESP